MKTPVIIPAHNEASRIGKLLEALPADLVEPIVAVNGSQDNTAEVAASFGALVLDIEAQGKLPAIQYALRHLGSRALEPLLMLDADSIPVFPVRWHNRMTRLLEKSNPLPTVVTGVRWFSPDGTKIVTPFIRSLFAVSETIAKTGPKVARTAIGGAQYGGNVAVRMQRPEVLDEVMALDHYWPKEDRAFARAIVRHHGTFKQSLHPDVLALTPESPSFPPLLDVFKYGSRMGQVIDEAYARRGASGSVPYDEFRSYLAEDIQDTSN